MSAQPKKEMLANNGVEKLSGADASTDDSINYATNWRKNNALSKNLIYSNSNKILWTLVNGIKKKHFQMKMKN